MTCSVERSAVRVSADSTSQSTGTFETFGVSATQCRFFFWPMPLVCGIRWYVVHERGEGDNDAVCSSPRALTRCVGSLQVASRCNTEVGRSLYHRTRMKDNSRGGTAVGRLLESQTRGHRPGTSFKRPILGL